MSGYLNPFLPLLSHRSPSSSSISPRPSLTLHLTQILEDPSTRHRVSSTSSVHCHCPPTFSILLPAPGNDRKIRSRIFAVASPPSKMTIIHVRPYDYLELQEIASLFSSTKKVITVTGAGISTTAGIPVSPIASYVPLIAHQD